MRVHEYTYKAIVLDPRPEVRGRNRDAAAGQAEKSICAGVNDRQGRAPVHVNARPFVQTFDRQATHAPVRAARNALPPRLPRADEV